jgi:hypothetical protein
MPRACRRLVIIRLDDTIPNPVAQIARLFQRAVVNPFGKIGLVFIGDERGFDFFFISPGPRDELVRRDLARNQLGRKLSCALDKDASRTVGCSSSTRALTC